MVTAKGVGGVPFQFGDDDPDDAFTDTDVRHLKSVNDEALEYLAERFHKVMNITDRIERLEASKRLVAELAA